MGQREKLRMQAKARPTCNRVILSSFTARVDARRSPVNLRLRANPALARFAICQYGIHNFIRSSTELYRTATQPSGRDIALHSLQTHSARFYASVLRSSRGGRSFPGVFGSAPQRADWDRICGGCDNADSVPQIDDHDRERVSGMEIWPDGYAAAGPAQRNRFRNASAHPLVRRMGCSPHIARVAL